MIMRNSYTVIFSIPEKEPGDIQNHIENIENKDEIMQCIGNNIEIIHIRFARNTTDCIE